MSHSRPWTKIAAVVLLAGMLPWLASFTSHLVIGDARLVHEPLHEGFQLAGSCIALAVAMLLLLRLRRGTASTHLRCVVAALVGMGIIDGVHGLVHFDVASSWSRHVAALLGGTLSALVWLPQSPTVSRRCRLLVPIVATVALAVAVAIWWWPQRLPTTWAAGEYSGLVIAFNALGGLGFLAAAAFFARGYLREPKAEDLVFASYTLLFGTASLFYGVSHAWAADWWVWQAARLVAYAVVLGAAYDVVGSLYESGFVQDITERKQAEDAVRRLTAELDQRVKDRTAELEAANRELEAFSYSVSHDLRAPLRAIDGYGRILAEDYSGRLDPEGQRLLGVISSETRRMGQLIDDLLAFSRLGRQKMESATIDMATLARAVFADQAAQDPERALRLELTSLPAARGDRAMIRVVLDNLISNAIKFTAPRQPAVIEIGGRREDGETVYWVKDNGVGFDMSYAHKLFGVFQRLHSRGEFDGTGVGLALAQRVIHRHGGRIWADGIVDGGAVFSFSLPDRKGE